MSKINLFNGAKIDQFDNWLANVSSSDREKLIAMDDIERELAFSDDLKFGTGGARGKLGLGTSRLNFYTVQKIANGYAVYLKNKFTENKVVIAYDSRFYSKDFGLLIGTILENNGIQAFIFDNVAPTPLLSFAVREMGCTGGVMITASHNPKEYNGIKLYDDSGAQLNLNDAQAVLNGVNEQEMNFNIPNFKAINYVDKSIINNYIKKVTAISFNQNVLKNIKITFSAVNGTSCQIMPEIFKKAGFNKVNYVTPQMEPDPTFLNVKSINPEDEACFDLALDFAHENKSDLIMITDPDADRVGIMIKVGDQYQTLTGNQVGALLINYIVKHTNDLQNKILYKTIVTGELGAHIAKMHGSAVEETLTGFKFIGEKIKNEKEKQFLFGYEESYGYLIKDFVRDKDAIQSALIIAEMTNYYLSQGKNLFTVLDELYEQYFFTIEKTISYTLKETDLKIIPEKITQFEKWSEIAREKVTKTINYATDDTGLPKDLIVKKFLSENGWVVLRPSGTEPKIKAYICLLGQDKAAVKKLYIAIHEEFNKLIND